MGEEKSYVMVKLSSKNQKLLKKLAEKFHVNLMDICYEILESYEPILRKIVDEKISSFKMFIEEIYRVPLSLFIIDSLEHEILEPLGIYDYYELEEVSIDIGENRFIFMLREKETSPYNTGDWFLEFNGEEWVMVFSYIFDKVSEENLKKMKKVKAPFRFSIILSQAENKSALAVKITAKRINDLPKLDKISKLLSLIRGYVVERK